MIKLTFPQKNNFVVKHSDAKFFDKDLELFKQVCPGHKLNNQLTKVSDYNKSKLVGQMLFELLDKITPAEIIANRDKEIIIQPDRKTVEQTKEFLLDTIGVDEDDIEEMGDAYIEFLSFKSDEELIDIFAKLLSSKIADKQASYIYVDEAQGPAIVEEVSKMRERLQEIKQDPVIVEKTDKAEQANQDKAQDPVIVEKTDKAEQSNQDKAQDPVIVEKTDKAEQANQDEAQDSVIVEKTDKAEQSNQDKAQDPVIVEKTDKKKEAKPKNSPK